jgi:pyrrolidone-carboxylate peptidase
MRLLVTGFGPFADAQDNASGHLARESGHPFEILEVAYQAVDECVESLIKDPPEAMLLMGVDVRASKLRLETVAHNTIGPKADVRGEVWGPGPIDPKAPPQISATLWSPWVLEESAIREPGYDAGGYLCNYSFFRAVQWLPATRVGFIHVPPFSAISKSEQLETIRELLKACFDLVPSGS